MAAEARDATIRAALAAKHPPEHKKPYGKSHERRAGLELSNDYALNNSLKEGGTGQHPNRDAAFVGIFLGSGVLGGYCCRLIGDRFFAVVILTGDIGIT